RGSRAPRAGSRDPAYGSPPPRAGAGSGGSCSRGDPDPVDHLGAVARRVVAALTSKSLEAPLRQLAPRELLDPRLLVSALLADRHEHLRAVREADQEARDEAAVQLLLAEGADLVEVEDARRAAGPRGAGRRPRGHDAPHAFRPG